MSRLLSLLALLPLLLVPVKAQEKKAPAPELKLEVKPDYVGLHVTGTTNLHTDTWQWRVLPVSAQDQVAWSHFQPPGPDGTFKLATPFPPGGWHRVEVRAMKGDEVLKLTGVTRPEPHKFEMVTPERIATLPENQRAAWTTYVAQSRAKAKIEHDVLAVECRSRRMPVSKPAPDVHGEFDLPSSKAEPAYFASPEAAKLADVVISYQTPSGSWSKAVDYSKGPRPPGTHWTVQSGEGWHYCGTLDNHSTTEQIKFLARVHAATKRDDCRQAMDRGLEWLYAAQFPNGGWPQVYPLEPGYHEGITLNDDAMMHALEIMLAISTGAEPFEMADEAARKHAQAAFDRGLQCLLDAQVTVNGALTVWCAQHDPITLAPVKARLKEPASLSGAESTSLLKFLMRQGPVTAPVRKAIEDAVTWLEAHKVTGLRKIGTPEGRTDYAKDSDSTEVRWARFYDVTTGEPLFAGAQDGIIYKSFHDMAEHNKVAYDYFTTKPLDVTTKEMARWRKRLAKAK